MSDIGPEQVMQLAHKAAVSVAEAAVKVVPAGTEAEAYIATYQTVFKAVAKTLAKRLENIDET
jgi:hypothetical protein